MCNAVKRKPPSTLLGGLFVCQVVRNVVVTGGRNKVVNHLEISRQEPVIRKSASWS